MKAKYKNRHKGLDYWFDEGDIVEWKVERHEKDVEVPEVWVWAGKGNKEERRKVFEASTILKGTMIDLWFLSKRGPDCWITGNQIYGWTGEKDIGKLFEKIQEDETIQRVENVKNVS